MLAYLIYALTQLSGQVVEDANVTAWARQTTEHDRFWIMQREIRYENNAQAVVVWMHGDHRSNKTVNYRTSLWRLRFACDGTVQITASTTLDAHGKEVASWDGYASPTHIRPGTIYESIEKSFCVEPR